METPMRDMDPDPAGETAARARIAELQIALINVLTTAGRANWMALLAYLTFVMVTLLAVRDVDFFLASRQTSLPLVGVSIPTRRFFLFAPVLGVALHVYLHLFIRKLTGALTAPPSTASGVPLDSQVSPWLLNDMVLRRRRDGSSTARPLDTLSTVVAWILIWFAAPIVLGYAWWRGWSAHSPAMSLLCFATLAVACLTSLATWRRMRIDLGEIRPRLIGPAWLRTELPVNPQQAIGTVLILVLGVLLTLIKTQSGLIDAPRQAFVARDSSAAPSWDQQLRFAVQSRVIFPVLSLAPINLDEAALTPLPTGWLPWMQARDAYRIRWCAARGIHAEACGPAPWSDLPVRPNLAALRHDWCARTGLHPKEEACDQWFRDEDRIFIGDWSAERWRETSGLDKWVSGRGADLRRATLKGASLTRADLRGARLQGANLSWSNLETALLNGADLRGATLLGARMDGADFGDALLDGADLRQVSARTVNFVNAELVATSFAGAKLDGANFTAPRTDPPVPRLDLVDFSQASMRDAIFGRPMGAVILSGADMSGVTGLQAGDLDHAIGTSDTRLMLDSTPAQLRSCWDQGPEGFPDLLQLADRIGIAGGTSVELQRRIAGALRTGYWSWICDGRSNEKSVAVTAAGPPG